MSQTKIEAGARVRCIAVPSLVYDKFIGQEGKADTKVGEVSGRRLFLFNGTNGVYLDDSQVEIL